MGAGVALRSIACSPKHSKDKEGFFLICVT